MKLRAAVVAMGDQLPGDVLSVVMARMPKGSNSLQMVQHVYSAPETPAELKLKLAVAAMPFEVPKPERVKDSDADNEKVKQASDERIRSRLADLFRKAGVSRPADGGSAAGDAPAAEQVRAVS
jgi:hypothetical protein